MRRRPRKALLAAVTAAIAAIGFAASPAGAGDEPFVGPAHTVTTIASTVPPNGDVNPYGVAVVPRSIGALHAGDVLVSNFNAASNLQGTGTTIVQISPSGDTSVFAAIDAAHLPGRCPGGVGLTTALSILPGGWVVVGSLPTTDGQPDTIGSGCLIVLDSHGKVRKTITGHGINGPWDMTATTVAPGVSALFVSNVLNGTVAANGATVNKGTVVRLILVGTGDDDRIAPHVQTSTVIGSGFPEHTDPAALVVGPTGLGLGKDGTLYVADSAGNRIAAIPDALWRPFSAGTGRTVTSGGALNTPLGLAVAPNGNILTVNGGDGFLVETTPHGRQVATRQLDSSGDPPGAGALFGLAVKPGERAVYFVDDAANTLNLLH
jgi:hypothetical protein